MLRLLAFLGAIGLAPLVSADLCRGYYEYYNCDNSGLSIGARIGIGVGIAVAVIALFAACSYWRRKQLRKQFSKYRPPALPFTNGGSQTNPYASNPPPPPAQPGSYYNQSSNWNKNQYGQNPSAPANVYQPSMAGAYGNNTPGVVSPGTKQNGNDDHEHGYEWAQAREAERLEREQAGTGAPPPGYEVSSNTTGSTNYGPPAGPPPKNVVS